jgi:hypothetical protein
MHTLTRGLLLAGALALAGTASAKGTDGGATFGVSVEASTLGLGLSVGMPLGERFNVRGAYHTYDYELDQIEDAGSGATYDGELNLQSAGLFADWHPFKGGFRITAGLVSNGNEISLTGQPTGGQFEVGDCTFQSDPSDPLAVDGTVEFASTAPYVGIGWGGNLNAEPGFFMTLDLGLLLSGSPDTNLTGRGSASNADPIGRPQCGGAGSQDVSSFPEFQQAVQDAEDDVNDETKDFEYWPNIALGIGWRF